MVGRHHAALAVGGKLHTVDIVEDLRCGAEVGDEADRLLALLADRARAADERRDLGGRRHRACDLARREDDRPALAQPALGERDHLDHALISLARAFAEGEDAVLVEDEAFDARIGLEHLGGRLGETKARRDIGHNPHASVIDLARQRLPVGLIDEGKHRGRMGVVHEFVRQKGMEQRLDRRIGRGRVEQIEPLHIDHGLVRQGFERAQLAQGPELHRRQAPGLDIGHIGARALDRDHLVVDAEIVASARLDRGVAAAMQHEERIAAQEPRGVDPKRDVGADPFRVIGCDHFVGSFIIPFALHGARCCRDDL